MAVLSLGFGIWTLSWGMRDLIPWLGIKPGLPALGVWNLSHCTTREVPGVCFYAPYLSWGALQGLLFHVRTPPPSPNLLIPQTYQSRTHSPKTLFSKPKWTIGILKLVRCWLGLPMWHSDKDCANAGDVGSIPGSGWTPGEGNGKPLQYSCLENSMDRWAWLAIVQRVTKNWTWLSN